MSAPWEVLCRWGVPAGAVRPLPDGAFPGAQIANAVAELGAGGFASLDETQRECLLAWLQAFGHHWPHRYAVVLGGQGPEAVARLRASPFDPDRYLKLRRIAVQNLAATL
jgi:hypothetical protein